MQLSILAKMATGLLVAALPGSVVATPAPASVAARDAAAPAATSVVQPVAKGFLQTCGEFSNTESRLNAKCRQTVGIGLTASTINLDICLGNDNGKLVYPGYVCSQ